MGKWASVGLLLCGKRGAKLAQTWWELAAFEARKFRTELVANWEMGKFGPNSDRPICGLGRVATFMLLLLAHLFCLPTFSACPPLPQTLLRALSLRARSGAPQFAREMDRPSGTQEKLLFFLLNTGDTLWPLASLASSPKLEA